METLIVIPSRISSTRLQRKMMADIGGKPLIARTYESAIAANVGDVIVACDCAEIADVIHSVGGMAVITDSDLPSGTDRVFSAWTKFDQTKKYEFIVNLQGDLPFIGANFIAAADKAIRNSDYDISTLATPIKDQTYLLDNIVKPVISFTSGNCGKALYFSRTALPFNGPYFHHVGIYCFCAEALRRFVSLPQSTLEKAEKLEQLRALENDMTIGITVINSDPPISVDTSDDLAMARKYFNENR